MNIEQGLRIENENLKRLLEQTERERDNLQIMVDANLRVNGRLRTLAIKNGYNPAGQLNELEYLLKRFDDIKQERDEALAYGERVMDVLKNLQSTVEYADNGEGCYVADGDLMISIDRITSETQPAALAALKAEWQAVGAMAAWVDLKRMGMAQSGSKSVIQSLVLKLRKRTREAGDE